MKSKVLFLNLAASFLVKFAFYLIISIIYVWLLSFAGIISEFKWAYVLVGIVTLFIISIMFKPYIPELKK